MSSVGESLGCLSGEGESVWEDVAASALISCFLLWGNFAANTVSLFWTDEEREGESLLLWFLCGSEWEDEDEVAEVVGRCVTTFLFFTWDSSCAENQSWTSPVLGGTGFGALVAALGEFSNGFVCEVSSSGLCVLLECEFIRLLSLDDEETKEEEEA